MKHPLHDLSEWKLSRDLKKTIENKAKCLEKNGKRLIKCYLGKVKTKKREETIDLDYVGFAPAILRR